MYKPSIPSILYIEIKCREIESKIGKAVEQFEKFDDGGFYGGFRKPSQPSIGASNYLRNISSY